MVNHSDKFKKIIDSYCDALVKSESFKGVLSDYFSMDKPILHALFALYTLGIHHKIGTGLSPLDIKAQYKNRLITEYGVRESIAEEATQLWVTHFKIQDYKKFIALAEKKTPEKPQTPLENIPRTEKKPIQDGDFYCPCGFGNQDFGFIISGIKNQMTCLHRLQSVYSVIFSLFQQSIHQQKPSFIVEQEKLLGTQFDYGLVYRYLILILLLIKNNYHIRIRPRNHQNEINLAVKYINNIAQKICGLTNLAFSPIQNEVDPKAIDVVFNMDPNHQTSVAIKDTEYRIMNHREVWYAPLLRYTITVSNSAILDEFACSFFRVQGFRNGQKAALISLLNSTKNTLCIMPTGAGKSLIYFMISYLQPCPCIIISPSNLLIHDQISMLKDTHRIDDVCAIKIEQDADYSTLSNKINYITPLDFLHYKFLNQLLTLNHRLQLSAVILDEVHCISNWSHDFRPEYLMLSMHLRTLIDKTVYYSFTATANYSVVKDVIKQLDVHVNQVLNPLELRKESFQFRFLPCPNLDTFYSKAVEAIEAFIDSSSYSSSKMMVFTHHTDLFSNLKQLLKEKYQSEVDEYSSENPNSYKDFANDRFRVLLCDYSLGIGVNIPRVTHIMHIGLPVSKSEFVQQIGRASRNNELAFSTVFYLSPEWLSKNRPILLNRTYSMDVVLDELSQESGKMTDLDYAYRLISNDFDNRSIFTKEVIGCYRDIKAFQSARTVTFRYDTLENVSISRRRIMKKLYILYRTGIIKSWYIEALLSDRATFMIDPVGGISKEKATLSQVKEVVNDYFFEMTNHRDYPAKIKKAISIEEVLTLFVAWLFDIYLYRQKEQVLEMYDFLSMYHMKSNQDIQHTLKNFFSLSLLDIQTDSKRVSSLTIPEVFDLVEQDLDSSFIENIRLHQESIYSIMIDIFIFYHQIHVNKVVDHNRFSRILTELDQSSKEGFLAQSHRFFMNCSLLDKLYILNAFLSSFSMKKIIDTIYFRLQHDEVFYLIEMMIINRRLGDNHV